jgi:hypothetical protein
MDNLKADTPAKLFRFDGEPTNGKVLHGGPVLDDSLERCVSVAMNDEHGEIWRYSIATDGPGLLTPDNIADLAEKFGTQPT